MPRIGDRYADKLSAPVRSDHDFTFPAVVFHCIGKKIEDDLLELQCIGQQPSGGVDVRIYFDRNLAGFC